MQDMQAATDLQVRPCTYIAPRIAKSACFDSTAATVAMCDSMPCKMEDEEEVLVEVEDTAGQSHGLETVSELGGEAFDWDEAEGPGAEQEDRFECTNECICRCLISSLHMNYIGPGVGPYFLF